LSTASSDIPAVSELVSQVRAAANADLYYLALFGALVLPDICGALDSDNGRASGPKYKDWVRKNVPQQAGQAEEIYGLRCSLLHQGRALPHGSLFPVAFTFPSTGPQLHNLSTEVGDDRVGWLSIPVFVDELTQGVERWLAAEGESRTVVRNLKKFARLRPEGLPPHVNWPVVA
jgi:hypothetical protein